MDIPLADPLDKNHPSSAPDESPHATSAAYLAGRGRPTSPTESAEEIIDRVLYFDGLPNLQRFDAFMVGETVLEQLQLALELEREAVEQITSLMAACTEEGDIGTREFLAPKLLEEQTHISWLESQLTLVQQIGEANYLTQQVRE